MDFALFLLANLTLFVRPGEIIPALEGVPIYNYLMLATLATVLPRVINHFRPEQLAREPITACVLCLVPAVALSHLSHFDTWSARTGVVTFARSVTYYLVLISVVRSTWRLRFFLYSVACFTAMNAVIAILHYYGIIDIPSIRVAQERMIDPATGDPYMIPRLCATGIFGDPNDLSMITVAGILICVLGTEDTKLGIFRIAWTIPLALFFATLLLTKSRGGLLAFVAAGMLLSYLRFGIRKTAIVGALCLPLLAMFAGGRQADLSGGLKGGTGEARIELWSDGLTEMKRSPVFGIGFNNYNDAVGQVAHNSFVHTFVELGIVGGALFLGTFWFAAISFWKLRQRIKQEGRLTTTAAFRRLHPYLATILCGFAVSMFSLSRAYVEPVYLGLGVANVYFLNASRRGIPTQVKFSSRRLGELLAGSLAFLVFIYLFIKVNIR
ncbi:MAG: O-antigen ligase family protein [Planctomycetia bacterium]|nr:O-antigen ligase family protein [Planctomycetia bacterium]